MGEGSEVLNEGDVVASRYLVESRIGKGGMGAVYAALDQRLGRRVALKALASKWAKGPARKRLEAEAKAVALLAHDGIVTLFDVVEHDAELVLVMELVAGESLRSRLARGPMPPSQAASVIAQVADALGAAHAVGLVHRDVKPDNVILRAEGRTKLLDFGIATAAASESIDPLGATLTVEGQVVGTPAYLSPEQLLGEHVSPATDQFALAVTAYELMTGHFPWRSTTVALLASDILHAAPQSLASRLGSAPRELEAVFVRALAKKPEDRHPSIGEFAAALGAASAGFAPHAHEVEPLAEEKGFDPYSSTLDSDDPQPRPAARTRTSAGVVREPITRRARGATDGATAPSAGDGPRGVEPPRGSFRPWHALVAAAVVLATLALAVRPVTLVAPSGASAPSAASAIVPAPDAPLRFDDLPASATESAEALAKYRAGVGALGSGASDDARVVLDEALRLDPTFASAALQRAYDSFRRSAALDEPGRAAFRTASAHRDQLSRRDVELLEAMTPAFGDPPDWKTTAARLATFVKERPGDEQGWDALAMAHVKGGDQASAKAEYERVLRINPRATVAYLIIAQMMLYADETAEGRAQLERCLRAVPEAQRCRRQLAASLLRSGECQAADRLARDMTVRAPRDPAGYELRAEASAGLGAPDEAVAELLRQRRAEMPEARRPTQQALDEATLAYRRGDFDAARDAYDAAARFVGSSDDELLSAIALWRARSEWEAGRTADAAKVAAAFVDREAARKAPERMAHDGTPQLLRVMRDGGVLDEQAYIARRDAWVAGWKSRSDAHAWRDSSAYAWVYVFGGLAPTPRDAADALAARSAFHAERISRSDPAFASFLVDAGALLLAAGQPDEAEPYLRDASRACAAKPEVRATYLLGTLLEAKGDTKGACAAYADVERRWGKAKPTSVTARAAKKAAARCKHD